MSVNGQQSSGHTPVGARTVVVCLAAMVLIGLVLRLVFGLFVADAMWQLNQGQEGNQGLDIAHNILLGKGLLQHFEGFEYRNWRPPVFPLFLAGVLSLFGEQGVLPTLAVLSALAPLPVFFLASRIFDQRVGLLSAGVTAVFPSFIYSNGWPSPEAVIVLLALAAMLFLFRMLSDPRPFVPVLAGVFVGLSALCRSWFLMLVAIVPLWLYLQRHRIPRWVRQAALVGLGAGLVMTPWLVRNAHVHGKVTMATTDAGLVFFAANVPSWLLNDVTSDAVAFPAPEYFQRKYEAFGLTELARDRHFWDAGAEYVKAYPGAYARRVLGRIWHLWKPYPYLKGDYSLKNWARVAAMGLSFGPALILGLLGAYLARRRWRELCVVYLLVAGMTAATALIHAVVRYRVPLEPFFIIWGCSAIVALWDRRSRSMRRPGSAVAHSPA